MQTPHPSPKHQTLVGHRLAQLGVSTQSSFSPAQEDPKKRVSSGNLCPAASPALRACPSLSQPWGHHGDKPLGLLSIAHGDTR